MWRRRRRPGGISVRRAAWRGVTGAAVAFAAISTVAYLNPRFRDNPLNQPTALVARPSAALSDVAPPATFEEVLVAAIRRDGALSVTLHVALADRRLSSAIPAKFGDGRTPATNLFWGAQFGVETFLTRKAGWKRVHADEGDGRHIVRRVVLHKRASPSRAWRDRGIETDFDLFLLACAWPSDHILEAMAQPFRDAIGGQPPVAFSQGDRTILFGAGSQIVGYLGQNGVTNRLPVLDDAANPEALRPPVGLFHLCRKSAVYFHADVVDRQLYPILFVREDIVPEGYLVEGLLEALIRGTLDDGFVSAAAEHYARWQKGVRPERARMMLFR